MTDPGDIPTSVTKQVYAAPHLADLLGGHVLSQNESAEVLAVFWDAIERHFREKIAQEIETSDEPAPWMYDLGDGSVVNGSWIDRRDGLKAAWIARGRPS